MQASFVKEPGRPFIDLNTGMFYRRPEEAAETRKRRPTITVPDRLLAHMRRWARMGLKYAVEVNGKPVKRVQIGFRNAVADAGLGKDVTPHILRHTAATWLMLNGTDIWQAAGFSGDERQNAPKRLRPSPSKSHGTGAERHRPKALSVNVSSTISVNRRRTFVDGCKG